MPFIRRDGQGRIDAVFARPEGAATEEVAADAPELLAFLDQGGGRPSFVESDLAMARVLEDLIDLLIDKGVVMFSDFPEAARRKLLERHGLRKEFAYVDSLFAAGDDDLAAEVDLSDPDGERESLL
ncbi:MAG: hypothetical protein KDE22_04000 [Rhodobacterales bacterium]|nr:hypothetical protein [Rhodobacterales bacterium]